jgi:transposase
VPGRVAAPWDRAPHRPQGVESSEHLGRFRWVAERTLAWLAQFRRLVIRYERLPEIHAAFLCLGCSLICLNFLSTSF